MSYKARLAEAQLLAKDNESWHLDYKDSAYIYAGGLSYDLTEGDVVCIFSQYGEVLDINLIRDKNTGVSKGFAFLRYEDQRSTILAVDNLGGAKVLGRSLRVDHVNAYKQPKRAGESAEDWDQDPRASMNVAPAALLDVPRRVDQQDSVKQEMKAEEQDFTKGIDPEDPMYEYLVNERRIAATQAQEDMKDSSRRRRSRHDSLRSREERRHRHRDGDDDTERKRRRHLDERR